MFNKVTHCADCGCPKNTHFSSGCIWPKSYIKGSGEEVGFIEKISLGTIHGVSEKFFESKTCDCKSYVPITGTRKIVLTSKRLAYAGCSNEALERYLRYCIYLMKPPTQGKASSQEGRVR